MGLSFGAYLLLGLAIVCVPVFRKVWVPLGVFAGAVVLALVTGVLNWAGLVFVVVLGAVCAVLFWRGASGWVHWVLVVVVAGAGHLAMTHGAPGFANLKVLSDVKTSAEAVPYSMYLNFDKGALGFLLWLFAVPRLPDWTAWRSCLQVMLVCFVPSAVVLIGLSSAAGLVVFDPKIVGFLPLWVFANLLLVSVAEEVLFRQFVMGQLMRVLGRSVWAGGFALMVSSAVFAAYHLGGGVAYAGFSMIAGLCYGAAFWASGRVEAAIGVHFLVNLTHILLFTYPMLAR